MLKQRVYMERNSRHDPSVFRACVIVFRRGRFERRAKTLVKAICSAKLRAFGYACRVGAARAFALCPEEGGCPVHGTAALINGGEQLPRSFNVYTSFLRLILGLLGDERKNVGGL